MKKSKLKRNPRGKDEWGNLTIQELSARIAQRFGRIEILRIEIRELQELIEIRYYKDRGIKRPGGEV